MEITCPRCQSLHEIEPPASARARPARSLKFRCSHCGHTFAVDTVSPAPEAAGPPPLDAAPDAEPIKLVQVAGKTWAVPDLAALHRWVLERRIDRESLVSHHGLRWTRAGEREDLAVFFSAADALSFQERNLRTEMPGPPDEEIIVDAGEADEPGMPVAVGPDPFDRRVDVDPLVMDFTETREDTAEQTVHSMGVDEAPIPAVPAGFDRADVADRTERMPARPPAPPEFPAGLATVTPGPAPAGALAEGRGDLSSLLTMGTAQASDAGPAVTHAAAPAPAVSPAPSHSGPAVGGPSPAGPAPAHSASQGFFLDSAGPAPGASSGPRRDVFEDPPTGPVAGRGGSGAVWAGLALVAGLVVVGWLAFGRGGEAPSAPTPPAVASAEAPATDAVATEAPAPGTDAAAPPEVAAKADAERAAADKAAADKAAAEKAAADKAAADKAAAEKAARAEAAKVAAAKADTSRTPAAKTAGASTGARAVEPTTGGSPKKLIGQGWKAIEAQDYPKAHSLFDRALQSGPSADALYGRGYANEKLGDAVSAADDFCKALSAGAVSIDISREIQAGLRRVGRTCN